VAKDIHGRTLTSSLHATSKGAKVVAKDIHGRTPFDVACNDEVKAVMILLLLFLQKQSLLPSLVARSLRQVGTQFRGAHIASRACFCSGP
jgi:hypothetical protein